MEHILIVVDMQNDFIDGALGTKEAAGIVGRAVSKIQGFDGRIIATLDTHGPDYLDTAEGRKLPVPHCIKPTDGWQLNRDIAYALSGKEYQTIEKPAFGSVELVGAIEDMLAQKQAGTSYRKLNNDSTNNVDEKINKELNKTPDKMLPGNLAEIELIGLCTDICVVSNALLLKTYFPELAIRVDASCCAGVTPQTHQAALETMKMCQIDVYHHGQGAK